MIKIKLPTEQLKESQIGHMDKDPYQRYFYTDFRDLVMSYDDK